MHGSYVISFLILSSVIDYNFKLSYCTLLQLLILVTLTSIVSGVSLFSVLKFSKYLKIMFLLVLQKMWCVELFKSTLEGGVELISKCLVARP